MKKLSIYLFLILFGFSAQSYADDISDFEIGGISIGDSALKYYSEKKIKKELSIFFSIEKTEWIDQEYEDDEGKTNASFFYFDNGDSVDIQCTDWNSTVEFRDNLRVSLWTAEFGKFITSN